MPCDRLGECDLVVCFVAFPDAVVRARVVVGSEGAGPRLKELVRDCCCWTLGFDCDAGV